ncbi:MAG: hypothetical protein SFV19_02285 [Rhodospirillaceae bacterium]|nr:hypothetical protein [Rhodospirillaceae bacterium]
MVSGTEDRHVTHIGRFEPSQPAPASDGGAGQHPRDFASAEGAPRGSVVYPWGRRIAATRLNSVGMGILLQYLRQRAANASAIPAPIPWPAKPRTTEWPSGRA